MENKLFIIISAPSGGGKDTVIDELLKIYPASSRLTTTTSRKPRWGEKDGRDYFFVSKKVFEEKIKNREFLEHNFFAGNYYGSEKAILESTTAASNPVFSTIDINGKRNLDHLGIKNLSIFLLPESIEVLRKRLKDRGGLSKDEISKRLEIARGEISNANIYDYRVVNSEGKLPETVAELRKIIDSELNKA